MAPKSKVADLEAKISSKEAEIQTLEASLAKAEASRAKLKQYLEAFRDQAVNTTQIIVQFKQLQEDHNSLQQEHQRLQEQLQRRGADPGGEAGAAGAVAAAAKGRAEKDDAGRGSQQQLLVLQKRCSGLESQLRQAEQQLERIRQENHHLRLKKGNQHDPNEEQHRQKADESGNGGCHDQQDVTAQLRALRQRNEELTAQLLNYQQQQQELKGQQLQTEGRQEPLGYCGAAAAAGPGSVRQLPSAARPVPAATAAPTSAAGGGGGRDSRRAGQYAGGGSVAQSAAASAASGRSGSCELSEQDGDGDSGQGGGVSKRGRGGGAERQARGRSRKGEASPRGDALGEGDDNDEQGDQRQARQRVHQQQQQGVITQLRQQLEELQRGQRDLAKEHEERLRREVASRAEAERRGAEALQAARREVGQLQRREVAQSAAMDELKAQLQALQALVASHSASLARHDQQLTRHRDQLGSHEDQLTRHGEQLTAQQAVAGRQAERLGRLEAAARADGATLEGVGRRLAAVEAGGAAGRGRLDRVVGQLRGVVRTHTMLRLAFGGDGRGGAGGGRGAGRGVDEEDEEEGLEDDGPAAALAWNGEDGCPGDGGGVPWLMQWDEGGLGSGPVGPSADGGSGMEVEEEHGQGMGGWAGAQPRAEGPAGDARAGRGGVEIGGQGAAAAVAQHTDVPGHRDKRRRLDGSQAAHASDPAGAPAPRTLNPFPPPLDAPPDGDATPFAPLGPGSAPLPSPPGAAGTAAGQDSTRRRGPGRPRKERSPGELLATLLDGKATGPGQLSKIAAAAGRRAAEAIRGSVMHPAPLAAAVCSAVLRCCRASVGLPAQGLAGPSGPGKEIGAAAADVAAAGYKGTSKGRAAAAGLPGVVAGGAAGAGLWLAVLLPGTRGRTGGPPASAVTLADGLSLLWCRPVEQQRQVVRWLLEVVRGADVKLAEGGTGAVPPHGRLQEQRQQQQGRREQQQQPQHDGEEGEGEDAMDEGLGLEASPPLSPTAPAAAAAAEGAPGPAAPGTPSRVARGTVGPLLVKQLRELACDPQVATSQETSGAVGLAAPVHGAGSGAGAVPPATASLSEQCGAAQALAQLLRLYGDLQGARCTALDLLHLAADTRSPSLHRHPHSLPPRPSPVEAAAQFEGNGAALPSAAAPTVDGAGDGGGDSASLLTLSEAGPPGLVGASLVPLACFAAAWPEALLPSVTPASSAAAEHLAAAPDAQAGTQLGDPTPVTAPAGGGCGAVSDDPDGLPPRGDHIGASGQHLSDVDGSANSPDNPPAGPGWRSRWWSWQLESQLVAQPISVATAVAAQLLALERLAACVAADDGARHGAQPAGRSDGSAGLHGGPGGGGGQENQEEEAPLRGICGASDDAGGAPGMEAGRRPPGGCAPPAPSTTGPGGSSLTVSLDPPAEAVAAAALLRALSEHPQRAVPPVSPGGIGGGGSSAATSGRSAAGAAGAIAAGDEGAGAQAEGAGPPPPVILPGVARALAAVGCIPTRQGSNQGSVTGAAAAAPAAMEARQRDHALAGALAQARLALLELTARLVGLLQEVIRERARHGRQLMDSPDGGTVPALHGSSTAASAAGAALLVSSSARREQGKQTCAASLPGRAGPQAQGKPAGPEAGYMADVCRTLMLTCHLLPPQDVYDRVIRELASWLGPGGLLALLPMGDDRQTLSGSERRASEHPNLHTQPPGPTWTDPWVRQLAVRNAPGALKEAAAAAVAAAEGRDESRPGSYGAATGAHAEAGPEAEARARTSHVCLPRPGSGDCLRDVEATQAVLELLGDLACQALAAAVPVKSPGAAAAVREPGKGSSTGAAASAAAATTSVTLRMACASLCEGLAGLLPALTQPPGAQPPGRCGGEGSREGSPTAPRGGAGERLREGDEEMAAAAGGGGRAHPGVRAGTAPGGSSSSSTVLESLTSAVVRVAAMCMADMEEVATGGNGGGQRLQQQLGYLGMGAAAAGSGGPSPGGMAGASSYAVGTVAAGAGFAVGSLKPLLHVRGSVSRALQAVGLPLGSRGVLDSRSTG